MLWIAALVVATFLIVVAVLSVAAATLGPEFTPLEVIARSGMKVGHLATAVLVLGVVIGYLQGHRPDELWVTVGYSVAAVGVPTLILTQQPDADGSAAEPPHLYVITIVAIATAALAIRLVQTW
ncbi:MAG: hypothetical protein L0H93_09940 [Nocardioides sp.]|nr:hypothetical protein [Nocardioides sp.]